MNDRADARAVDRPDGEAGHSPGYRPAHEPADLRQRRIVVLLIVVVGLVAVSFLPLPGAVVSGLRLASGLVTLVALVLALRR